VVGAPGRGDGKGGALIDVFDARARADALGSLGASLGGARVPVVEGATTGVKKDGAAFVELAGHDAADAKLAVSTRVELAAGARHVVVTTTITNRGDFRGRAARSIASRGAASAATGPRRTCRPRARS
jgi:hypothetical protein